MQCRKAQVPQTNRICCLQLVLLKLLLLPNININCIFALKINTTTVATTRATLANATNFVPPHRYTSHNNITKLHEVHEIPLPAIKRHDTPSTIAHNNDENDDLLVLNTDEVLPTKPVKKKPYTLFMKDIITEHEKPRPLKEYDLHPVTFDFNLGDLEDIAHETIKKGDLSTERKHLLRGTNADDDDGDDDGGDNDDGEMLIYTERATDVSDDGDDDNAANLDVDINGTGASNNNTNTKTISRITKATSNVTTTSRGTQSSSTSAASPPPTVITISPHIFKVLKNKTSKKSTLKKDDTEKSIAALGAGSSSRNNFNTISRYFGADTMENDANGTAEGVHAANLFQIITNLYDHFYWKPSEIRNKVTTGCGLEMQAYLTALHGSYAWAQRAYDASGRYRGQLFFGNDKWLGQKIFCYELNQQLRPDERKHFEFEFYAALIALRLWIPQKLDVTLQIGECLPKTCTSQDIEAVLALDPHAQMLSALSTLGNSTNATWVQIRRVRTVPGIYSYWHELKFQILISFMMTVILIVIIATWYQAKLNQRQLLTVPIQAISTKIETRIPSSTINHSIGHGNINTAVYNCKGSFELYQMKTLNTNDNNNVVDIETGTIGKDSTNTHNSKSAGNSSSSCSSRRSGAGANNGTDTPPNTLSKQASYNTTPETLSPQPSPDKDYKLDTCSNADAADTYEVTQQLGIHEQLLLCFAFQTNAGAILNIDVNIENRTSCVHGLRVFSVLWTIMVHTYLQIFTIGENRYQRIIVERSLWYQFVGNATFSVDTFFFISGFLVTLLYLKQEKKYPEDTGQFVRRSFIDTGVVLVYRYIRLTPAYLFVIFFNDFTLRQTFDGSVFQPTVATNTCAQFWWRNILYINNFYPLSEICMIWSWYMANDMQFYIMASFLLVFSLRYFKTILLILVAFLLSSWAISGIVSIHYQYTHKVANPFESFDILYDKPWQRVGTYIMGMVAGYIAYMVRTPPKISQRTNLFLWACSFGLLFLIIFGVWNGELSVLSTAFYVSMAHTAFGIGLIWIVLSCCWGLSPTMNRILSYRGLWPLSRLTYCTYLVHPVIMLIISFRMSGTVHLNNLFVMTIFFGNAVVSFCVAFFISVLFEAPVIRILKICFKK